MTPAEVRVFQRQARDWEGKPLLVDGDLGPRTAWALAMSEQDARRQAIVDRACSRIGVVELGRNRGPEIDAWLKRCGAPLGSPWCAAFASWCLSVNGLPLLQEAGAQTLGRKLRATLLVLPGDLMWFRTGPHTGHCGIVIGMGPGEVACVEGNHGDGVRIALRSTNEVHFATPLPPQTLPAIPPGLTLVRARYEGTR